MSSVSLVEVFRSVQGEGYHAGRAAIFVRLAGCNLSCVFAEGALCDTPYQKAKFKALVPHLFSDHILPLLPDAVKLQPRTRSNTGNPRWWEEWRPMLILTGGEPTLAPAFDEIVDTAWKLGFYVAVETNGTRWREGLMNVDWITVSPKSDVPQGSPFKGHNPNPGSPALAPNLMHWIAGASHLHANEFRYVIGGADTAVPPYYEGFRHYLSPAVLADGTGLEWQTGFPGFAPGALERCLEIVWMDPRWRVSLQTHKLMGVR